MIVLPAGLRNLPVLNLLTGQKSGFSPRRGDSLHRFTSNLAWPTSTWFRKISPQLAQGWECGPQNMKNFHFLVKSRLAGANRLTDFYNFFMDFYTPSYPALVLKFDMICFTGYGVIDEKPRVGHLGQFFRAPCRKKLCVGSKNECHLFNVMISTSSITMRSWGRSYNACRL